MGARRTKTEHGFTSVYVLDLQAFCSSLKRLCSQMQPHFYFPKSYQVLMSCESVLKFSSVDEPKINPENQ